MQPPASRTPQPIHRCRRNPNRRPERDARRCGRRHRPHRARTVANAASGIPNSPTHTSLPTESEPPYRKRRPTLRSKTPSASRSNGCRRSIRHPEPPIHTSLPTESELPYRKRRPTLRSKTPSASRSNGCRRSIRHPELPNPYIAADEAVHAPHEKKPHCNGAFRKRLLQYGSLI